MWSCCQSLLQFNGLFALVCPPWALTCFQLVFHLAPALAGAAILRNDLNNFTAERFAQLTGILSVLEASACQTLLFVICEHTKQALVSTCVSSLDIPQDCQGFYVAASLQNGISITASSQQGADVGWQVRTWRELLFGLSKLTGRLVNRQTCWWGSLPRTAHRTVPIPCGKLFH